MSGVAPAGIAACPVVVTVNLDVETLDAQAAGAAGLFGRYSYGRYGAREGLWRILNLLADAGVRATFFVSADDAGRHAALLEAILAGGHEIAAQGSPISPKAPKGPGDLASLAKARATIAAACGVAPLGWRTTNGLVTAAMLRALAATGFAYDSSFQDDDLPYAFDAGGVRPLVELPVCDYLTDATFYAGRHTPDRVRKVFAEEFNALHAAGAYVPLTLHTRGDTGTARAIRAQVIADFLADVAGRPGVRFYRADELAALVAATALPEPIPDWPL
jgi:peptidoglycan/xylan/chitin deacetylase (PgdA/CDA1 family)